MCDNFKGWVKFSETALGIESNVCFPHATGKAFTLTWYCSFSNCVSRTAAIPSSNYLHVKYFQNRMAYNDFYNIMVGICEISVITFANQEQALLVNYLRESYGDVGPDQAPSQDPS